MGDEDDRAREALEGVLEHVDGIDIEMVGGLVEAEQCLGGNEHLGQRKAGAFAAGKDPHALIDVLAGEEEGTEQAALLRDSPGRGNGVDLL